LDLKFDILYDEDFKKHAIGVFDSGVGGLTVLSEIKKILPNENVLYLGDSARGPYGSKSMEKIKHISLENSLFLSDSGSKIIVIACNTATAVAKEFVESHLGKKVIGVIDAGVKSAINTTKNNKIGVIGTTQTIKSQAHKLAINKINPEIEVFSKATPIFATLVEEGFIENKSTTILIEEELTYFKENRVDTLILGCTHYPFLEKKINEFFGGSVTLINPAKETALELKDFLLQSKLTNPSKVEAVTTVFTSDSTETFVMSARKLLNNSLFTANVISIDSFEKYNVAQRTPLTVKNDFSEKSNNILLKLGN